MVCSHPFSQLYKCWHSNSLIPVILVCSGATTQNTAPTTGKGTAAKTLQQNFCEEIPLLTMRTSGYSKPLQFEAWIHLLSHGINPEAESLNAFLL